MDEAAVVVVGGGPGGLAVVRAYREAGGSRPVRLLTAEGRGPYFRPHLSKEYLRGELDAADLPLEPQGWYDEHGVDLVLGAEVTAVDPVSHTVTVRGAGPVTYSALVTLKDVAWGDGFDEARFDGDPSAWTVWYGREGTTVGVLTHDRDADHERGRDLVERAAPLP